METKISLPKLQLVIHNVLKSWHQARPESGLPDDLPLLIFRQAQQTGIDAPQQAANQILLKALDTLAIDHNDEADLLRSRFLDGQVMYAVANRLNISEATAYRKQNEAIEHLARIILAEEMRLRAERRSVLEKHLEAPTYLELVGVEAHLEKLLAVLTAPEAPWLVSIEGTGGIGKTALADALSRRAIEQGLFTEFGWASAKQIVYRPDVGVQETGRPALTVESLIDTLLPQLGIPVPLDRPLPEKQLALLRYLKAAPALIVVDNLETAADLRALLPFLRQLANPAKILLTSRHSLYDRADMYSLSLNELSQADTLQFIRREAKLRGMIEPAEAPAESLHRIYKVVGGNPLALKLVIGQIAHLSLPQVLENLREAQGKSVDDLYTFIYWQAWHMLNETAQQVLLVMPLAQGGTINQLLALGGLDLSDLLHAIQQLVSLSLVQVIGGLEERRYTIHRLTETFLLKEAIQWQSPA